MNEFKLTVLTENRVDNPLLIAEQGLSLLIETPELKILFDTGQTESLVHNARHLGINLQKVNYIVLSHGHYDHGGGLYAYLNKYHDATIVAHPNVFNPKYSLKDKEKLYIGFPFSESDIKDLGGHFIYKQNHFSLGDGIVFSGEIKKITDYEKIEENYVERVLESTIQDEMKDDSALYIKSKRGLIVITGCAHSGIVNTIKYGMRLTDTKIVHAVMGGMHLKNASLERIEKTVKVLKEIEPDILIPMHCTGFTAISKLVETFKDKVKLFNVGDVYRF